MLLKLLVVLLCFGFAVHANTDETAPRVKTPLGGLRGYYKISQNGRKYEAYEGIPYALPPIGKLRFKPPRPTPAWIGELPATKFSSMCIQYDQISVIPPEKVVGAEDCLYLNIYVPAREKGRNITPLPILFWIHGGAFQFGSGMLYDAKYLMDHNVIFVTFNYRVGPMGFLSTEDEVVPGNMGLKDQSMALRWVSENIEWFGGDPEKVTLVGLSAGGASVHYHYLSQLSANLFKGGISFSGTAFPAEGVERKIYFRLFRRDTECTMFTGYKLCMSFLVLSFFSFVLLPIVDAQRIGDRYRARARSHSRSMRAMHTRPSAFCFAFSVRMLGK